MATWVLLRGLGREAGHWHDVPARLANATGDRVLTPDLPGVGRAADRRPPWTIAAIARDVAGRVAAEIAATRAAGGTEATRATGDAVGPLRVLGHSLGGMVALRWAALAAAGADADAGSDAIAARDSAIPRPDGLVVIGTSLGRLSPPWRRMRPATLPTVLGVALARTPRRAESRVLDLTSTAEGARREAVLDAREPIARARPVPPGTTIRQLVAAAAERGPRPTALPAGLPLLVLAGARDRLVAPACSRAVVRAFGGELHVHPAAGHDVPLDDPAWLIERLTAWAGGPVAEHAAGGSRSAEGPGGPTGPGGSRDEDGPGGHAVTEGR